jgi:hypothetical protein
MLSDPFGVGTAVRPGMTARAPSKTPSAELVRLSSSWRSCGAPFYAFHDRDVAPEGASLRESNSNLDAVVKVLKEEQKRAQGIRLLWGTGVPLRESRYMHGAATSPNADAFAVRRGAGQESARGHRTSSRVGLRSFGEVGKATRTLLIHGPEARDGPPRQVPAHGGRHKKAIGFKGQFYIEAEAERADEASIRLRRSRLPQLPARVRPPRSLQAEPRDEPRHARGPHDAARARGGRRCGCARLHRREHGRPAPRLGHRSVPDGPLLSRRK